jgi:quinol monooxygenase YgiN
VYGRFGQFRAQPGGGDALGAVLLEAADGLRANDGCLLYVISRSDADPDVVWVTEAWTDRSAHTASLQDPAARALISRAMPLIAAMGEATEHRPVGGKGIGS